MFQFFNRYQTIFPYRFKGLAQEDKAEHKDQVLSQIYTLVDVVPTTIDRRQSIDVPYTKYSINLS